MIGIGIISRFQKNINNLSKKNIAGAIREVYDNRERVEKALADYKIQKLGTNKIKIRTIVRVTGSIAKLTALNNNTTAETKTYEIF